MHVKPLLRSLLCSTLMASDKGLSVHECQTCGELRLGRAEMTCCDNTMEETDATVPYESPDTEHVVQEVFGISATELEICRHIMSMEEATIDDLLGEIHRDRSVVTRHLNHLVDLGIVEKSSQVLSDGGRINVYSPQSEAVIRRCLKLGIYRWCLDAIEVIEGVSEEKIEVMAESMEDDNTGLGKSVVDRLLLRDDT